MHSSPPAARQKSFQGRQGGPLDTGDLGRSLCSVQGHAEQGGEELSLGTGRPSPGGSGCESLQAARKDRGVSWRPSSQAVTHCRATHSWASPPACRPLLTADNPQCHAPLLLRLLPFPRAGCWSPAVSPPRAAAVCQELGRTPLSDHSVNDIPAALPGHPVYLCALWVHCFAVGFIGN